MILISNGPSAERGIERVGALSFKGRFYTPVAGVNWVAEQIDLDWWCLSDWAPITGDRERGIARVDVRRLPAGHGERPARWYSEHVLMKLGRRDPMGLLDAVQHATVTIAQAAAPELTTRVDKWWSWSGTLALGLVWWLAPQVCDIYGMDLGGTSDCRGDDDAGNRSDHRWAAEREMVARLLGECRKRGVRFRWGCSPVGVDIAADRAIRADGIGPPACPGGSVGGPV